MNFRFITHLRTFTTNAVFHRLVGGDPWEGETALEQMTDPSMPHKTLMLRVQENATRENWLDDLPMADLPAFTKWSSMRNLIARARRAIEADQVLGQIVDPSAPLGRVVISVLKPQSTMAWHSDLGEYAQRHLRFHISLVTNPRCHLHCGGDTVHVPQGTLTFLNALNQHSATNFGDEARAHAIFEMRGRQAEPTDEAA